MLILRFGSVRQLNPSNGLGVVLYGPATWKVPRNHVPSMEPFLKSMIFLPSIHAVCSPSWFPGVLAFSMNSTQYHFSRLKSPGFVTGLNELP